MIALARIHIKPLKARSDKKKKMKSSTILKKTYLIMPANRKKKKVLEMINLPTVINKVVFKLVAAGLNN